MQSHRTPSGKFHTYCAYQAKTFVRGDPSTCGMCLEEIRHTGNGKVHENCRFLREQMGERAAKRYLQTATAKRQKVESDSDEIDPEMPELVNSYDPPPFTTTDRITT